MMIIVNRVADFISGSVNGKPFNVTYSEERFKSMKSLEEKANQATTVSQMQGLIEQFEPLTKESFKEVIESSTPYLFVNPATNRYYLKFKSKVSSIPLPQQFVDKILQSVEKSIDITPLIKCWGRFLRRKENRTEQKTKNFIAYIMAPFVNYEEAARYENDGFTTEVAIARATSTQVAITQEGLLNVYKVSKEIHDRFGLNEHEEVVVKSAFGKSIDPITGLVTYNKPEVNEERIFQPYCMGNSGDAFFCGDWQYQSEAKEGHIIQVGKLHWLKDWNQVNTSDNQIGVKGLHVGGLNYIKGFQTKDSVTHNIFVDPMDIGAIVGLGHGNDGAMRVRRYFVHSSFEGVNRGIYHSSKYAQLNDAEYQSLIAEVVEATEKEKIEIDNSAAEAASLI